MGVRVLVVSAQPLFGQGIEAWLRQQRGLDILGWEAETGKAIANIQHLQPDVIILDTSTFTKDPTTALMQLLSSTSDSAIIGVDLRDNSISIFSGEQQATQPVGELLRILREHGIARADHG
jgi:chemotaxis response regulator CheB